MYALLHHLALRAQSDRISPLLGRPYYRYQPHRTSALPIAEMASHLDAAEFNAVSVDECGPHLEEIAYLLDVEQRSGH